VKHLKRDIVEMVDEHINAYENGFVPVGDSPSVTWRLVSELLEETIRLRKMVSCKIPLPNKDHVIASRMEIRFQADEKRRLQAEINRLNANVVELKGQILA
jgi:hypothetical protein